VAAIIAVLGITNVVTAFLGGGGSGTSGTTLDLTAIKCNSLIIQII
jgi:hypothetical protein